ncbi:MAG: hypothetical protein BHW39_05115 [Firmicutes bacterium CAG:552_39_19]|nr:MAG: hypothetical protein BHW39_05115 [Firmicutes bacterium CAG:552_39_19]
MLYVKRIVYYKDKKPHRLKIGGFYMQTGQYYTKNKLYTALSKKRLTCSDLGYIICQSAIYGRKVYLC